MTSDQLQDEIEIVWLEPPERFLYLREGVATVPHKNQSVQLASGARLIGFGIAGSRARAFGRPQRRWYRRRFFWLSPSDPYRDGTPADAVDPASIRPGVASKQVRT